MKLRLQGYSAEVDKFMIGVDRVNRGNLIQVEGGWESRGRGFKVMVKRCKGKKHILHSECLTIYISVAVRVVRTGSIKLPFKA